MVLLKMIKCDKEKEKKNVLWVKGKEMAVLNLITQLSNRRKSPVHKEQEKKG